jgi:hypothetical protein
MASVSMEVDGNDRQLLASVELDAAAFHDGWGKTHGRSSVSTLLA